MTVTTARAPSSTHTDDDFERIARSISNKPGGDARTLVMHGGSVCLRCSGFDDAAECSRKVIPLRPETDAEPTTALQSFTFSSLTTMTFPPLASLPVLGHDEVIVQGYSHILTGDPKTGKTTLLVNVMQEWTERGETIRYYSEESARTWDLRRREMPREVFENDNVTVVPAIGVPYKAMLGDAGSSAASVIVVDTIRGLWGFDNENDNSEVIKACKPWVAMSQETGKTLVLTHHDRKSGGNNGLSIAGGGAFLAVVDMAVMVTRDPNAKLRRKVATLGRVLTPVEFMYELDGDHLRDLGNASALQFDEVKRRILEVLSPEIGMTAEQVRKDILDPRPSLSTIERALGAMASIGNRVRRDPDIAEKSAGRRVVWLLGSRKDRAS